VGIYDVVQFFDNNSCTGFFLFLEIKEPPILGFLIFSKNRVFS
jgi:hypothetical protein